MGWAFVITTTELTKRYGTTTAVDSLSVEVRPGLVTGFLGPNGAGKSTTLRMILGLDTPSAGAATVNGQPFRELRHPLRQVGALLDASAVAPGRSAYQHLAALARSNRIPQIRIDSVLSEVGLDSVARRRVGTFSLGMKQRLGIAAALLGDPGTLLFDEPLNGLDPEGVRWIRLLFKRLAAEGRTVLVSSHMMGEMQNTADHLIVIGSGRLISDGTMAEFVKQGRTAGHVRVRGARQPELSTVLATHGADVSVEDDGSLRVTGLNPVAIGDVALARGFAIYELTPHTATLEEAFMELTADQVDYRSEPSPQAAHEGSVL
jgi:ABC-2 type transport system ATP-binding protein